jgi:tellurite resistance protein
MRKSALPRVPLNTFAIPLGLTGLAEIWSDAGTALHLPVALTEAFWVVATAAWLWMITAHIVRGARADASFASQLKHPAQGPIAAIIPIVGMLIGINLHAFWPVGGTILIILSIVAATLFAGWILAFWLRGEMALESVHGAYFLPSVAASFVAGGAASVIGAHLLATAAFAAGAFFWVVMFVLVAARLAFRPPLPAPLTPTMAILMAPPAVGGLAWFAYDDGKLDAVEQGLLGIAVLFILMQLQFARRYVHLTFSLGFWSFAFPTAFMGAFIIVWFSKAPFIGWQIIASAILAIVTLLIAAIAISSFRLYVRDRSATPPATQPEATLAAADASIESMPTKN